MLPSTTRPTTINRFQMSLDSLKDAFNLSHQLFKTVRMISNNINNCLTNQNNIKVHCQQMYVFLTIKVNHEF